MTALISAPGVERTSAKDMLVFVNGRWIKDKSLRFAVLRGYHSHLLRGKYPVVALFLTLDSGLVDANVHPAKTEVRLQYATEIHSMVAGAIRDGLRKADWASHASHESLSSKSNFRATEDSAHAPTKSFWSGAASSTSAPIRTPSDWGDVPKAARWRDVTPAPSPTSSRSVTLFDDLASDVTAQAVSPQVSATQSVPWHELSYMGAVADCYLLFGHGDRRSGARLLAVDQHAFHERVLYERLMRDTDLLRSSQTLLVPEGVTLDPGAVESLKGIKSQLESNGFRYDIIDESTVEVRAVPVLLAKSDLQALFESLARHETSAMPLEGNAGLTHDILSTMACHGAVRAGEALGESELKILINEAKDVDFFHNCPHGRRVFRWWDEAQIARWFDR
jgi:DNA mismatch repair protein MutL